MSNLIADPPKDTNTIGTMTSSQNENNNTIGGTENAISINTVGYNDNQTFHGRSNFLNNPRQDSDKGFIPNPFPNESLSDSEIFGPISQPPSHFKGMRNINNMSQSTSAFDFNGMNNTHNTHNISQTDNSSHFHNMNDTSNIIQTKKTSRDQAPVDYYGEAYNNIARERNHENEFRHAAGNDGQASRIPSPVPRHDEPQYYGRDFYNPGGSGMEVGGSFQGNYRYDNDSLPPQKKPNMSSAGSFGSPQSDFANPNEDYDDEGSESDYRAAAQGTRVNYEEDSEYRDEDNEENGRFDNDESPSNSIFVPENSSRRKNQANKYHRIPKRAGAKSVRPRRNKSHLISSSGRNRYSPIENLNDIDSMSHPVVIQGRNGTTRATARPDGQPYTQPNSPLLENPENYFNDPGRNLEQSRYSGANIPWGMNLLPKTVPQSAVTDAALIKRNLKRGNGEKVCKRSYGANDPENIAIVNMKENDHLSFAEIVRRLNDKRIETGKNPGLSVCGVTSRYNRTAPLLFAAQGKAFVPLSERRKGETNHGEWIERPKWTDEMDVALLGSSMSLWIVEITALNNHFGTPSLSFILFSTLNQASPIGMRSSSVINGSQSPLSRLPTSDPSSPPEPLDADMDMDMDMTFATTEEKQMFEEEKRAQIVNARAEEKIRKLASKKRAGHEESKSEREAKARQLDELLDKSAVFADILTKKTKVLGRVGSGFDGKAIGEHNLEMAKQPKCMIGGKMRDYQLEGLTWMYEICSQGMSGILADEMGLGKTIQTISLIALLREQEDYLGPHLIIAPLSTLSNWIEEFQKWTPDVPVLLYHGNPGQRKELRRTRMMNHLKLNRPDEKFPVVCTSPEILLRDYSDLSNIKWEFIIIDEGHRMKNSQSKLFLALRTFKSASRLLITGTPLQNNLKELWSLLNFLLPTIFTDWEQFDSWFDFSGLQDEEGTEEFLADQKKQDLVKKMHLILQPLLLRRIKADVEHMLPKKREYVLYAPMTKEQTDLYNIINDKKADTRKYLEDKVVERLTGSTNTPTMSRKASPKSSAKVEDSDSDDNVPLARKLKSVAEIRPGAPKNAFQQMMLGKKVLAPEPEKSKRGRKRKSQETPASPALKSVKSSRQSTPASSRSRKSQARAIYTEANTFEDDDLSDDEFEQKLAKEFAEKDREDEIERNEAEIERAKTLELAKKEISSKKLGNPIMQLRLTCNSPHNFYNPWSADSGLDVDETLITSSGKMLLLDRLLPALFERGHKVLIFSQFKTQLDIIEDYAKNLRGWNVCRIDGSVAQDYRRQQIKEFNENLEFKLFLLSTRAGGQGINLASADTVILFDSDWNPQQDLQAQDRAHRIGQMKPVVVFRLATKGTVEEDLLMSADAKRRLEKLVIKKGGFRTMGQKMDPKEALSQEALRTLLLKDGQVYKYSGDDQILSDEDLDILCDRSDAAYARAEKGLGNAEGFKIVETKIGGLMTGIEKN
ncbi:hypothetical protein B7494_g645 [Chlorociboria aeruginascens]|nr:hypothetical protein B7494_g645 [Chlorociboria aeruginascens]